MGVVKSGERDGVRPREGPKTRSPDDVDGQTVRQTEECVCASTVCQDSLPPHTSEKGLRGGEEPTRTEDPTVPEQDPGIRRSRG